MSAYNGKTPIGKALSKPVSRRHFFSLSAVVGSLSVIGMTSTSKSATIAYADEAENIHYNVVEINREEIPVLAVDITNSKPISGMQVKATSYDLKSSKGIDVTQTVTTDDAGTAVINVRELSDDSDNLLDNYFAGLTIFAQKDGYQIYEDNYKLAYSGGNYSDIQIASKPIKKDVPYASCLSLAGLDIAYRTQEVSVSTVNDYEYDLNIKLRNFPKLAFNQDARLTLTSDRKEIEIENYSDSCQQETATVVKGKVDSEGIVEFYVKGKWFCDKDSLPHEGSTILAFVNVENYGRVIVAPKLKCISGEFFASSSYGIDYTVRPGVEEGITTTESAEDPDNLAPVVGKEGPKSFWSNRQSAFNLSVPFLGVRFWNTGTGNWGFCIKIAEVPLFKAKWRGFNRKLDYSDTKSSFFPDVGWKQWIKDADFKCKDANRYYHSDKNFGCGPICNEFDISLSLSGAIIESILDDTDSTSLVSQDAINSKNSKSVFSLQPEFSLSWEVTWMVFVWILPIGVGIDVNGFAKGELSAGSVVTYNKSNSISSMKFDRSATVSAAIHLGIEAGLSIGFGVPGFIGAFVRGYINIDYLLIADSAAPVNPTATATWEGGVQIVVELIGFKKPFWLFTPEGGQLYPPQDNTYSNDFNFQYDKYAKVANPSKPSNSRENSLSEESGFEMITEEMLRGVLESVGSVNNNGWAKPSSYSSKHKSVVSQFNSANLGKNLGIVNPYSSDGKLLYNPEKGFRVEYDHVIAKDVFFSSRMKTFLYQGDLYLLRISSVEIDVADNNYFNVYSNGVSNFIVANEDAPVPKVKRDKDNNVMLDANQNVVYDIPAGMNKEDVAVFGEDCFEDMSGSSNASKQQRVNAFFNDREAKGSREKILLNNKQMSKNASAVRTRVTCSKYNLETGEWSKPNVVDFSVPTTGNVVDERYNCFDTDMDVAVSASQVQLVITGTSRVDVALTDPKMEQVFQTQHIYSLTYNVITGEVKNVVVHAGNVHYSPKMPAFDWFSCYKHSVAANDLTNAGLYLYDNNYGNTLLNSGLVWGDPRIDDYFSSGEYHNHIVGQTKSVNTYSTLTAWHSSSEPQVVTDTNYGGLAAFWTTYYYEDVTGHYEIKHHFNFLVPCVDSITYLGEAESSYLQNYDRCIRYLIGRTKDIDGQRRYDIITFYYNSKNGSFSQEYTRSHDLFGSLRIAKVYPGQDANHLYAARIMDGYSPNNKKNLCSDNSELKYYGTKGPFSSGASCQDDPNETGSLFQLVEGRWSDKLQSFLHMFPIAQLDYEPDNIEYLTADDYIKYFMVTNVTDFDKVKGNIHIVGVPYINAIKLDEFIVGNKNIQPGDSSYIDLVVSNIGTLPVSGYTASIQVNDGKHTPFKILDNKVVEDLSPHFVLDELANYQSTLDPSTGKPIVDPATGKSCRDLIENPLDDEGVLWPGTSRSFRFDFTLPEDYEGEVIFKVSIKDPIVHDDSLFYYEYPVTNDASEFISWHDPKEQTVEVDSSPIVNNTDVYVSDVDYQVEDKHGKIIDETNPNNMPSNYDSPLDHSAVTNNTSDSTPVTLGVGALAIGAAAAGVAAYEKRRSENEKDN